MPIVNPLPSTISTTLAHQRSRTLALYRDWLRAVPNIIEVFRTYRSPQDFRNKIRENFEKNKHINDPQSIDLLIFKGRNELIETINVWKQDDHVERFFEHNTYNQPSRKVNPNLDRYGRGKNSEFLARFYEGNFAKQRSNNYA